MFWLFRIKIVELLVNPRPVISGPARTVLEKGERKLHSCGKF